MRLSVPSLTAVLASASALLLPLTVLAGPDDPIGLPGLFDADFSTPGSFPYQRYVFSGNTATISEGVNVTFNQGTLAYLTPGFTLTNNGTLHLDFTTGTRSQIILNQNLFSATPALTLQSSPGSFGVLEMNGGVIAQEDIYHAAGAYGYARVVNAANHTIHGTGTIGSSFRLNNFGRIIADAPGQALDLVYLRASADPVANAASGAMLAVNGGKLSLTAAGEPFQNEGLIAAIGSGYSGPGRLPLRDGTEVPFYLNGALPAAPNIIEAASTVIFDGERLASGLNTAIDLGTAGVVYAVGGGRVEFRTVRLSPDAAGGSLRNDGSGLFLFGAGASRPTQISGGTIASAGLVFDGVSELENTRLIPLSVANFGEIVPGGPVTVPPRIRARGTLLIGPGVDLDSAYFEELAGGPYSFGLNNSWTITHQATVLSPDLSTVSLDTRFSGHVSFYNNTASDLTLTFASTPPPRFGGDLDPTHHFDHVTFENLILNGAPLTAQSVTLANGRTDLATHSYGITTPVGGFINLTSPIFHNQVSNDPHPIRPQLDWTGGTLTVQQNAILDGSLRGSLSTLVNPDASSSILLGVSTLNSVYVTLQNLTLDTRVGSVRVVGNTHLGSGFQLTGTLEHGMHGGGVTSTNTVLDGAAPGNWTFTSAAGNSEGYHVQLARDVTLTQPLNLNGTVVLESEPSGYFYTVPRTLSTVPGGVLNMNGTLTDLNLDHADLQSDHLTVKNQTFTPGWTNVTLGALTTGGAATVDLQSDLQVVGPAAVVAGGLLSSPFTEPALTLYSPTTFTGTGTLIVDGDIVAHATLTFNGPTPIAKFAEPGYAHIEVGEAIFEGGSVPFHVAWQAPTVFGTTTLTLRPGALLPPLEPGVDGKGDPLPPLPGAYGVATYSLNDSGRLNDLTFLDSGVVRGLDPCGCPALVGTVVIDTPGNIVAGAGNDGIGSLRLENLVLQGGGYALARNVTLAGGTQFGAVSIGDGFYYPGKDIRTTANGTLTLETGDYGLHTGSEVGRLMLGKNSTLILGYGGNLVPGDQFSPDNYTLNVPDRGWHVRFDGGGLKNLTFDLGNSDLVVNASQAVFDNTTVVGSDGSVFLQGDSANLHFLGGSYLGGAVSDLRLAQTGTSTAAPVDGYYHTLTLAPASPGGGYTLTVYDTLTVTANLRLDGDVTVQGYVPEVGLPVPGRLEIPQGSTIYADSAEGLNSLTFSYMELSGGGAIVADHLHLNGGTTYSDSFTSGDIITFSTEPLLTSPGVTFSAKSLTLTHGFYPIAYTVNGLPASLPVSGIDVTVGPGAVLDGGPAFASVVHNGDTALNLQDGTVQNASISGAVRVAEASTGRIVNSYLTGVQLDQPGATTVLNGVEASGLVVNGGDLRLGTQGLYATGPVILTEVGSVTRDLGIIAAESLGSSSASTLTVGPLGSLSTSGNLTLPGINLTLEAGSVVTLNSGDGTLTLATGGISIPIPAANRGRSGPTAPFLSGTGTINGNVVVNGGTIYPGLVSISGNLTVGPEGFLQFQASDAASYGKVVVAGRFDHSGGASLEFLPGFHAQVGDHLTFLAYASATGLEKLSFSVFNLPEGYTFDWFTTATALGIDITGAPVPEPSVYAASAGLLALGLALRRRR